MYCSVAFCEKANTFVVISFKLPASRSGIANIHFQWSVWGSYNAVITSSLKGPSFNVCGETLTMSNISTRRADSDLLVRLFLVKVFLCQSRATSLVGSDRFLDGSWS